MQIPQKLNFVTSVSFWCLVAISILGVLQQQGILSSEIVSALDIILGSVVGVRAKNQVIDAISGSVSVGTPK